MKADTVISYSFENPNSPAVLEEAIREILVEMLLAEQTAAPPAENEVRLPYVISSTRRFQIHPHGSAR